MAETESAADALMRWRAAELRAAWEAGRDAAIAKCDAAKDEWLTLSKTYERCHAYAAGAAAIAIGLSKLTPPPALPDTIGAKVRRDAQEKSNA